MKFSIIAAVDEKMGIGKNGRLPWHLSTDLKFFHEKTTGRGKNAVVMGRLTWESIPENRRPLKNRFNIIITRKTAYALPAGVEKAASLENALKTANAKNSEEIFVIGGAQIFYDAMQHTQCETLYITEVSGNFGCDAFFPNINSQKFKRISQSEIKQENSIPFRFISYKKITSSLR